MSTQYRFATREEYPLVSRFLDEHWARNHIYVRNKELFDWTFARPGAWPEDTYSFALAEEGDDLVGILGGIPFTLNHGGEQIPAVWIVNYVIREDRRRGPMALQLLGFFRKPPFRATIAFGINPATAAIYKVLRGQVLPEIPRHFVVLPGGRERMADLLHATHPDWDADRIEAVSRAFQASALPDPDQNLSHSIPEDWDENGWSELAASTAGAVRDSAYLEWRYMRHPCFEHRLVAIPEAGRNGLAIWRIETIRRRTERGDQPMGRIARLLEFIPASPRNAAALTAAFLSEAAHCGAFAADFYGYHGAIRAWLAECGIRPVASHPDGDFIPTLFQPLDGHSGGIMSAMFIPEGLPVCSTAPDCSWYWTKSDSDQDRPN